MLNPELHARKAGAQGARVPNTYQLSGKPAFFASLAFSVFNNLRCPSRARTFDSDPRLQFFSLNQWALGSTYLELVLTPYRRHPASCEHEGRRET